MYHQSESQKNTFQCFSFPYSKNSSSETENDKKKGDQGKINVVSNIEKTTRLYELDAFFYLYFIHSILKEFSSRICINNAIILQNDILNVNRCNSENTDIINKQMKHLQQNLVNQFNNTAIIICN